ncbi:putative acetyltransferase [compost metagenome]
MMSLLKKIIYRFFYCPYRMVKNDQYISIGNSVLGKSFSVNYRVVRNKPSLSIGNECILLNDNIFESDTGFISIGSGTFINGGTRLISRSSITIGNNVTIAWGCMIYDHDSHSLDYRDRIADQEQQLRDWHSGNFIANKNWETVNSKPIVIGDNVWLGFDVVVLKGVTIGEGAIIGAKSVVTRDIPAWSVAAGNPAKVIKTIPEDMRG